VTSRSLPWPRIELGFGAPLGFAAGIATTMAAVAAGATHSPGAGLIALAVAVAAVSAVTTCAGAVMTAATCWALYAGFVLGRAGQLVLTLVAGAHRHARSAQLTLAPRCSDEETLTTLPAVACASGPSGNDRVSRYGAR